MVRITAQSYEVVPILLMVEAINGLCTYYTPTYECTLCIHIYLMLRGKEARLGIGYYVDILQGFSPVIQTLNNINLLKDGRAGERMGFEFSASSCSEL